MKKVLLSVSVLAVATFFGACKKSNNTPSNSASVMFVNGCAGNAGVNVSANNTSVSSASNLLYLKNTSYQSVTAGSSVNIAFISPSLGTTIISRTPTLTANQNYSVFLGGLDNASTFLCVSDDLTAPTSGNAKIRLVNLSSDNLSVRAQAGNTVFASGISSLSASAFSNIPVTGSSTTISAGDSTNFYTIKDAMAQPLIAGKIYTVIYTGTAAGTGSLAVSVINNN